MSRAALLVAALVGVALSDCCAKSFLGECTRRVNARCDQTTKPWSDTSFSNCGRDMLCVKGPNGKHPTCQLANYTLSSITCEFDVDCQNIQSAGNTELSQVVALPNFPGMSAVPRMQCNQVTKTCELPKLVPGDFCETGADCQSGKCLNKRCSIAASNEACGAGDQCDPGYYCFNQVCATILDVGQTCTGSPSNECGEINVCNEFKCTAPFSLGSGQECDNDAGWSTRCRPGLSCSNHVCISGGSPSDALGDWCFATPGTPYAYDECPGGLACVYDKEGHGKCKNGALPCPDEARGLLACLADNLCALESDPRVNGSCIATRCMSSYDKTYKCMAKYVDEPLPDSCSVFAKGGSSDEVSVGLIVGLVVAALFILCVLACCCGCCLLLCTLTFGGGGAGALAIGGSTVAASRFRESEGESIYGSSARPT